MSFFNTLGKIIIGLIFLGFIIGSITTYYLMLNYYPLVNKLQLVDKINNTLPPNMQLQIETNGEITMVKS